MKRFVLTPSPGVLVKIVVVDDAVSDAEAFRAAIIAAEAAAKHAEENPDASD